MKKYFSKVTFIILFWLLIIAVSLFVIPTGIHIFDDADNIPHSDANLLGDIDIDGDIDVFDVGMFAGRYDETADISDVHARCDLNSDQLIDFLDLGMLAGLLGTFSDGGVTNTPVPGSSGPTVTPTPTAVDNEPTTTPTPTSIQDPTPTPTRVSVQLGEVWEFILAQLEGSVSEMGSNSNFPRSAEPNGSWSREDLEEWTSGFFPGALWYAYEASNLQDFKGWAENWTAGMEGQKNDTSNHDIGFQIFNSFGNGYRLTQNEQYKNVILTAANSLSQRYHPNIRSVRSWGDIGDNNEFRVIIDNMMNIEMLFWASKNGGDSTYYDMAVDHADTTMREHMRDDGSLYHLVIFDPTSNPSGDRNANPSIKDKRTVQGAHDESAWSRGQAWGLYGFTMTFRETQETRFLDAAQKIADYYINNLPSDYIPYWDFSFTPSDGEERDTSSAAIAASGLFELSQLTNDSGKAIAYRNAADSILSSLTAPPYLATGSSGSGILHQGVGSHPRGSEINVSLIYGDYYFIEALIRQSRL